MTSRIYASAVAATLLILDLAWVEQASAQSAVPTRAPGYEAGPIAAPPTDVRARRHYHHHRWYYPDAHYGYYRPALPYDGYRPYPLPIYHCPYYGSPIPLYPYCWAW
jgi:hypothetical protein